MATDRSGHGGSFESNSTGDGYGEYFRVLAEKSPCSIFINCGGRVVFVNELASVTIGYSKEELYAEDFDFRVLAAPESQALVEQSFHRHMSGEDVEPYEYELLTKDGRRIPAIITTRLIRWHGKSAILGIITDVSEYRHLLREAERSEARYRSLFDSSPIAVFEEDCSEVKQHLEQLRRDGVDLEEYLAAPDNLIACAHLIKIVRANQAALSLFEADNETMLLQGLCRTLREESLERLRANLIAVSAGQTRFGGETVSFTLSGKKTHVLLACSVQPGCESTYSRVIVSLIDITEQKIYEGQIIRDAFFDPLTGLPNRALLIDRLALTIGRMRRRPDLESAVLYLDLDRFNVINESLGPIVSDRLLVTVAERLRACLRPGDTVSFLGGDEFAILLDDISGVGEATAYAGAVHVAIAAPALLGEHEVFTTASIGIAIARASETKPEDILRDAHTAMNRARAGGRGKHALFDEAMHRSATTLLNLETDLRRADAEREFEVLLQPIINLQSNRIEAFEALVRWHHPDRGVVHPNEFIPIAEETGLVVPIGNHVLRKACEYAAAWQRNGHPDVRLAVNCSAEQLSHGDLVAVVRSELERSGLPPTRLVIEITESCTIDNLDLSREILGELRSMGARVSLDDFGMGYSMLGTLRSLPIDVIKIDRSFVNTPPGDVKAAKLTQGIIAMAHSLELMIVAEGAETPEQVNNLRRMGCDLVQGFVFSEPVPAEQAINLLDRGPFTL